MTAVPYHAGRFPPDERLDWPSLVPLLGPANAAVARYDVMIAAVPDADLLLAPLATREAVLSSRIEGTQATMGEVLEFEAGLEAASPERRDDIHEVRNYRAALRHAEELLQTLPLSQRVVRGAHGVLLSGVRGQGKAPGEYRRLPNWIGAPGCGLEEARYVPIAAEGIGDAMAAWERYLHRDAPDRLVQAAILHAEFEALHPFLDGNGRLGRMMVPLFLWQCKVIARPVFYISAYFEAHRDAYYDGLLAVSRDDDWSGWCRFFLKAVRAQAEDGLARARGILALYDDMKDSLPKLLRSQYAILALDWMFRRPIFRGVDFVAESGIPASSARRFLAVLSGAGVLDVVRPGRGRRTGVYMCPAIFRIAEGLEAV